MQAETTTKVATGVTLPRIHVGTPRIGGLGGMISSVVERSRQARRLGATREAADLGRETGARC